MEFSVLGADGLIGRHLVDHLRKAGHRCQSYGRASFPRTPDPLGHVIFCIGLTADFRSRPFDTMRAHVCVLADALESLNFSSFLYLSSTRVYEHAATTAEQAELKVRSHVPSDLYNISKLAGEALCLSLARPAIRVARLSNVIGVDSSSQNFLASIVRDAIDTGHVQFHSALTSEKDYVSLEDVASVLPKIAEQGKQRLYNVASGRNTTHSEIAAMVRQSVQCTVDVDVGAPEIRYPRIDISAIEAEFDFSPTSLETSLHTLLNSCQHSQQ